MMDTLHQLEIIVNLLFQDLGPWLKYPMLAASFLGTEEFYLLLMPALFWCVQPSAGLRTAILLLVSGGLNTALKFAIHSPRPYWIDSRVQALSSETSFGMPSAHAQNATAIWGYLASLARSRWLPLLCAAVILLIGLSRIYLGMHFLSDVLTGWLLGLLILWLFARFDPPLTAWARRASFASLLWVAVGGALILLALMLFPWLLAQTWTLPPAWGQTAALAVPGSAIAPFSLDPAFSFSGLWLGMLAGAAWMHRKHHGYTLPPRLQQKIFAYLLGMLGLLILWYGLGKVFPRDPDLLSSLLRFLRYAIVSLWVSALAPLLFERLHLTR